MPTIYTSLKMAKWMGPVLPIPENSPVENTWNANIFRVQRKQWLFFIHNPTAFVLLFPEVKKADTVDFEAAFYARWKEQLAFEGIESDLIAKLSPEKVLFHRTNKHFRNIGLMTNHLGDFKYYAGQLEPHELQVTALNHNFNRVPTGPSPYTFPVKEMRKFLEKLS
jgi:hypothetical protein